MAFFTTFLKYLISDAPVIVTAFFCMWCVVGTWLPNQTRRKKWITIISIEAFEHLLLPLALFSILLTTDSNWSWILFHLTINLFLFGFLGYYVIKARTKDMWIRVLIIAGFTYFFVFMYPFMLITIQYYTSISGLWILGGTAAVFFGVYMLRKKEGKNEKEKI